MKKALFLIFHGFDPSNGISKKIAYQANALKSCGIDTHLCYMNETQSKKRIVDDTIIADYGNGILSKIKKRIEFSSIVNYAIKSHIEFVYIRSDHNANPFTIRMVKQMKKAGMKVVMEIPTYPYDSEYETQGMSKQIVIDKLFRNSLSKYLDAIITFSDYEQIFGQRTIRISNGIDFDSVKIKGTINNTAKEFNLIGVAEIHEWHGFERLVEGLASYYSTPQEITVRFHVVGYFFSQEGEVEFKKRISDNHLENYVILYGKKHGEELDKIFDNCDMGVGSLGRHRVGIQRIKTLKNREYAARGIPFIYSEIDDDFDNRAYVMKVPADETPINIHSIINFYHSLNITPQEIRDSIKGLSWKQQMRNVINAVYSEQVKSGVIKLAYCIPSLNRAGGMERVLTTKVNYLANNYNYDITILLTDGENDKPYFDLSSKIKVIQLDVNIDSLWRYPIWKRYFLYRIKMRGYKKKLTSYLIEHKPDITISLMRREINFINDIKDNSIKMGEIHFARYNYRKIDYKLLPTTLNNILSDYWIKQLERKVRKLKRFVVLTHQDAKQWKKFTNLCVISNPITINCKEKARCEAKQAITVGRYSHEKGYDMLIKAWNIVNKKHPEWILNIYGAGNKQAYENYVKHNNLSHSIFCHNATNDIINKYLDSSIYVLSSRYEGFPLVLGEAMSVGIPPVAFACPYGPIAIINNGEDGILCENGNIQQLAEGICKLIENEDLRKEMGRKAAVNIQRYSLDNIMQQWDHLFKEIIKERDEKNLFHS